MFQSDHRHKCRRLIGRPVCAFFRERVPDVPSRLANAGDPLSRYHILPHSSHTVIARVSLNVLLSIGDKVDKSAVENHPLALYASRYWVNHAKFEAVLSSIQDLMERLFDPSQPHFATWVWLYDMDRPWEGHMATARPMKPTATPLYYASLCGLMNLVEYIAAKCPKGVNTRSASHSTPLHAACIKGEIDTVRALLQRGADINLLDGSGHSPLYNASRHVHLDLVEILHEGGVHINLKNREKETPLDVALFHGNIKSAQFLIERGADVHRRNGLGWTPFHNAARYGRLDIVQLLLDLDVNVQVRSQNQVTPLILASLGGHVEVSRLLIERQADVTSADISGRTSLHLASQCGHTDVVQLLLDHGADLNV